MFKPAIPIGLRKVWKLLAAVATSIVRRTRICLRGWGSRRVKSGLIPWQGGARPGMTPQVKRVLMTFSLVLILEPIIAELARILLLHFMCT
jgi:hypothetical protein